MLNETYMGDYVLWTHKVRPAKDSYTLRKVQKDKKKLKIWINALLEDRDLIVFHIHEGEEIMSVLTKRAGGDAFADALITAETIGHETYIVVDYILANEYPTLRPIAIHVHDITKFMAKADGVLDISKGIDWYGHGYY